MSSNVPIVLVELGRCPRWLEASIRDLVAAAQSPVVLLTDNTKAARVGRRSGASVEWVAADSLSRGPLASPEWSSFRNGFWLETTRRFYALEAFQRKARTPLVHLESDVVIFPAFRPEDLFAQDSALSFPLYGPNFATAAVFASPCAEALRALTEHLEELPPLGPKNSDMTALRSFTLKGPGYFHELPSSVVRTYGSTANTKNSGVGIVDAAPLGIYLGGGDPRNARGVRRILDAQMASAYAPNYFQDVALHMDGPQLYARNATEDSCHPVLNLHIHSKDLRMFDLHRRTELLSARVSSGLHSHSEFDFWAAREVLVEGLRKRRLARRGH